MSISASVTVDALLLGVAIEQPGQHDLLHFTGIAGADLLAQYGRGQRQLHGLELDDRAVGHGRQEQVAILHHIAAHPGKLRHVAIVQRTRRAQRLGGRDLPNWSWPGDADVQEPVPRLQSARIWTRAVRLRTLQRVQRAIIGASTRSFIETISTSCQAVPAKAPSTPAAAGEALMSRAGEPVETIGNSAQIKAFAASRLRIMRRHLN